VVGNAHPTDLKYCVYLRGLLTESLTEEEQEFMRTMEQVDAWLEAEIAEAEQRATRKAKQENQQEIALKMLRKICLWKQLLNLLN
jgi:hypothetical protein